MQQRKPGPAELARVDEHLAVINGAAVAKKNVKPMPMLQAVSAAAIYRSSYPEPKFVISDVLTTGVTIFAGRPKIGKSWLTLQIAASVAFGSPLFGEHATDQGRVTYLALEEPESRTHHRLHRILPDVADSPFLDNLNFIYKIKPLLAGGAEMLDRHLSANQSRLCIVDTLLNIVQNRGSRDVMRSDYAEVNTLRELAERHDTAILVVAHSRKMAAEYHVDSVAGTSGVTAACDAIWSLTKKPDGAALEVTGREFESRVLGLKFNTDQPFGWSKTGEGEDVTTSEAREDIITLLREDAPLKPSDIAMRLRKNANTTRRLVQKMFQDGQLHRNSDGRYALREQREHP